MNMFINDDWVNVKLDTYGDSRNNYNLVSNPFGSQADARQTDAIDAVSYTHLTLPTNREV